MIKVSTQLQLVFGWGQVCTKNGELYFDTDNQALPEDVTLEGWTDFMKSDKRTHKAMHSGGEVGQVVYAFPMLTDIAKSLGFENLPQTGILVGVYVADQNILQKFATGEYTGFSIGGRAEWEDVDAK